MLLIVIKHSNLIIVKAVSIQKLFDMQQNLFHYLPFLSL